MFKLCYTGFPGKENTIVQLIKHQFLFGTFLWSEYGSRCLEWMEFLEDIHLKGL